MAEHDDLSCAAAKAAAMAYNQLYFLKKAYAIYPGVLRPRCAAPLAAHYERRRRTRSAARAALDVAVALGFLAWIPWRAAQVRRKFGLDEAWRRRAVRIARARFADPNDLALFRIDQPEMLDRYIRRFEDAALNKRINPLGWTRDCALADKVRFAARCRAAGLPHPETIAVLADGRLAIEAEPKGRDLLVKPANGEGGDGVHVLEEVRDAADLERRIERLKTGGAWLVQTRVPGHAELKDLSLNALSTVRVVTILDETGAPEVVSATLRLASRWDSLVDNMKAGGIIAAIGLEDGVLGAGWLGYSGKAHARHPATGASIVGRTVPDWAAVGALARRAHAEAFADYALIGWDIAPTDAGPLLIEGNAKPGVLMPQRAAGRGLAEGRYGELLAHHLSVAE